MSTAGEAPGIGSMGSPTMAGQNLPINPGAPSEGLGPSMSGMPGGIPNAIDRAARAAAADGHVEVARLWMHRRGGRRETILADRFQKDLCSTLITGTFPLQRHKVNFAKRPIEQEKPAAIFWRELLVVITHDSSG